jgi:hypothetical protein
MVGTRVIRSWINEQPRKNVRNSDSITGVTAWRQLLSQCIWLGRKVYFLLKCLKSKLLKDNLYGNGLKK